MPEPVRARRPLALVGMRCSGKSSVGRLLAAVLGEPFADLDELVAARAGRASAGRALAELGQARFRELEAEALAARLADGSTRGVLATGGGVVELAGNRRLLAERTCCVWLRVPAATLQARMERAADRPPLTTAGAVAEVPDLLARRAGWYREASHWVVEAKSDPPAELAARIHRTLTEESE